MIRPTTGGIRSDAAGDGHFGAPRGSRLHKGVDYSCYANEPVSAPMYGKIVRIAKPYRDGRWLGVLIRNSLYEGKLFYFDPYHDRVGSYVQSGEVIGYAQSISKKYPGQGMTDHVHWQIQDMDGVFIDPETLMD